MNHSIFLLVCLWLIFNGNGGGSVRVKGGVQGWGKVRVEEDRNRACLVGQSLHLAPQLLCW